MKDGVLQGIYRDLSILELTRRLILDHPVWEIPAMNRYLVEQATHPDRIDRLHGEGNNDRWARYRNRVTGADIAKTLGAGMVTIRTIRTGWIWILSRPRMKSASAPPRRGRRPDRVSGAGSRAVRRAGVGGGAAGALGDSIRSTGTKN
ncbi:hypothetical protein P7L74_04065 (plasmid) [Tistrella mobilis]|uniref:hypothetical protein n=1 Tax=Tistrella mobilis TaxID=171437 RepID=UPI003558DE8A